MANSNPLNISPPPKKKKQEKQVYQCHRCGTEYTSQQGHFFKASGSPLWKKNNGYPTICIKCIREMFNHYKELYDNKWALLSCLAVLDLPYIAKVFLKMDFKSENFDIGVYFRTVNMQQYQNLRFVNSLITEKFFDKIQDDEVVRWEKKDGYNKTRVVRAVKYDPFTDFSDGERKKMFALCSDYLTDESMADDPHKLKTIIEIIKMYAHVDTINHKINSYMQDNPFDEAKVKNLNGIKSTILTTINNLSKENGIASKTTSKQGAGQGTLAYHLKEMYDRDFTAVQVNMYDIETCQSMQQVADISAKSVLNTMQLTENDFLGMIEEQRNTLVDLQRQNDQLKEENRQLKMLTSGLEFQKVVI